MDLKTAAQLITENLPSVYGYAASRLYDRDKAEDLTSEIVCEVFGSIENLRDDSAFWGFFWRTAENTFRKFIRRESLRQKVEQNTNCYGDVETIVPSPEVRLVERTERNEQIYLIRRELSLLSKTRREVSVAYYIQNKSCQQISKELGISLEMVKYHLFKARKQMKEGLNMTRKLGEHSYNPGVFRINFWGDWNHYNGIIDRKLRGSILLAAYNSPLTAEELSVELGVAMPYLEEEIDALEAAGLLAKTGRKYQTDIPILTLDCQREVEEKTKPLYPAFAKEIYDDLKALLPEVRKLDFTGRDYDDNRLLFMLLNMAVVRGYTHANAVSPDSGGRDLPLGGHGFIWGHDNDWELIHFCGIAGQAYIEEGKSWFSAENYTAIEKCQRFWHSDFIEGVKMIVNAIDGKTVTDGGDKLAELVEGGIINCQSGVLSANFPVFSEKVYEHLVEELLEPVFKKLSDMMIKVSDLGTELLAAVTPTQLREQCADIAKVSFRLDVGAITMEQMIADGLLTLPDGKVPLCIYGVKK